MPSTWQRLFVWLAAGVLLAGLVLRFWSSAERPRSSAGAFNNLFPDHSELPGWTVSPQPIAETEEMKRAVAELLNFDAGSYIVYTSGGLRISIYAAYWVPGKMSHRLVASHTPDVCWTTSGWTCRARGRVELPLSDNRKLRAEHREFTQPQGEMEHVVFCHLMGGQAISYDGEGGPPWHAMFSDFLRHGRQLRQEQFFWRISSNRPLSEFLQAKPVDFFMKRLAAFPAARPPDA